MNEQMEIFPKMNKALMSQFKPMIVVLAIFFVFNWAITSFDPSKEDDIRFNATAMVSESSNMCVVMARVPERAAYDILVDLPKAASEHNVDIKGYRVSAYAGYVNNLYQRLLQPDGTWDDDTSGLLSQIRS